MISLLLSILKILGIILLVLLGIVLLMILLILFVPLRYTLEARRQEGSEEAFSLKAKATWLLHLLNVHAQYPQTPYLRARILCFTLFSTDKKSDGKSEEKREPKESSPKASSKKPEKAADKKQDGKVAADAPAEPAKETLSEKAENTEFFPERIPEKVQEEIPGEESEEDSPTILKFLKRILSIIQNIRYTIRKICDKIKHIVKNIRYYLAIIKSDAFKKAFGICKSQVWELLYSIRPRKIKGSILVGTGDPASTGQVFAVYGILYPFLGEQIAVTPDFERQVLAGELFVKGKVTVFWLVRAAWIIYFNKDLRRIIKMFKREAA